MLVERAFRSISILTVTHLAPVVSINLFGWPSHSLLPVLLIAAAIHIVCFHLESSEFSDELVFLVD